MEIFGLFQLEVEKSIKDFKKNGITTVCFNLQVVKCRTYPVCDSPLAASNGATSCQ